MEQIRRHANGQLRAIDKAQANKTAILRLRDDGWSWQEIATELGINYNAVRAIGDPGYTPEKRAENMRQRIRENADKIWQMRAQGMTWNAIADHFKCSVTNVRNAVDTEWAEKEKARKRAQRAKTHVSPHVKAHMASHKVEVLGEREPPDTRDLTARIFGDPIPGRRWIDRVKQQERRA